jgi:hypothetical protein
MLSEFQLFSLSGSSGFQRTFATFVAIEVLFNFKKSIQEKKTNARAPDTIFHDFLDQFATIN